MTVFYNVKHPCREEDTRALHSLIETVTLILPLEATTVNNPSDIRSKIRSDSRGDIRSDSSGRGATMERQRTDNGSKSD